MTTRNGFTLLEIGVALIIISVLIGGVLGGAQLRRNLQLNNIIEQSANLSQSVEEFQRLYKALPGDFNTASFRLGTTDKTGAPTLNGNGNGIIDAAEERTALQHLSVAGLLDGSYSTAAVLTNYFSGPIASSYFRIVNLTPSNMPALRFEILYLNAGTITGRGALTPQEMLQIDLKYDDGFPLTGAVRAANSGGTCINAATTPNSYITTPTSQANAKSCALLYLIKRQGI